MIFDGHSDLLYDVTRRRLRGETYVLERHHLDDLRRGGVEGTVLSLGASAPGETFWQETDCRTAAERTERMMDCARAEFAQCPWLAVVRTAAEARAAHAAGKRYAFLGVEGMAAAGEDLSWIDRYAAFGARMGMLTWNEENALAAGAGGDPDHGLTALGRQAVESMRRAGMVVDVSHLNERSFWDVVGLAGGVVIASHSNCRALCDVPRNLTDDQLRAIRDTGGVVGLNAHYAFVHRERQRQSVETLALHAAHMAEVMGVEHVCCGFDFCQYMGPGNEGARGLESAAGAASLLWELEKLGMSRRERELIARENLLRVLE